MKYNKHISFLLFLLLIGNAIRVSAANIYNTTVYYDNTETKWREIYLRIGRPYWTENNKANSSAYSTEKVAGTQSLYKCTISKWENMEAFSFANNKGWQGENSIYQPWNGQNTDQYTITGQTNYIKPNSNWNNATYTYVTNGKNNVDNGCQYYHVTPYDGLLKQTVNISAPENGSISVQYTDENGNSQTQKSGSFSVAQTCIITVTATPAEGYTLESLTVDGNSFNSGGTHIVRASTTIAATFRKNTPVYTVRFHANGHGDDPAAQQVEKNMYAAKPEMAAVKWYELEGWYTDEACTERWMFEKPVTRDMDLYAHWVGGNYPMIAVHASFLNWNDGGPQKMTKSEDGKSASYTHTFKEKDTAAEFGLRESQNDNPNEQADWWALETVEGPITASTTVQLYSENKIGKGKTKNIKITVNEPQEVTFTFDYVTKKLTVSYALDNQNKYRLVYVETLGGTTHVFHPSHTIAASEEARTDTVSLYVKPFERKAEGSNTNDCYVVLQQMTDGKTWVEQTRINVKEQTGIFKANGVYNFVLVQDGNGGLTVPLEDVHPYRGEYYIRLGLDRDYRSSEKMFRFSDYASKYDARFDHYFCKYVEGSDVRFCVACDYSACVSDTLAQEPNDDPHHDYTDAKGKLLHNANVRFMWNSENNHIDRAYLAGAGSNNVSLLSQSGISTTQNGGAETNVVLTDAQNWVYQHDVYAAVGTRVKLRVKPHNDAQENDYLYLKGEKGQGENDFSDENTVELIGGSTGQTLKVRVIYDFKSNHLICAWLPGQSNTIQGELSLNSDLILIRKEHNEAQQITFQDANAKITKVSQAYGVLSLSKSHLESGADNAKKFYWISFPFDVHLSEVFSALTYGKDYVLKYYDGAERAEKGCWKDSPSFWKMYRSTEGVTLKKGTGYLLHVNISNTASFFAQGNQEVNIYFPSANTDSMTISGEIDSTAVPKHTCTIQRDNRKIYDSNWNLIGVPSWANVDEMRLPNATEIDGISVKFLYDYVPNTNGYNTVDATKYNFGSMKAYMVQFAGTINWKAKSITPSQKPLRAPAAANEQTIRLDLLRGEERLDHTFVQLSDNEGITEDFDLNSDLTKVHNNGCNLYTLIGSEQIEAAANILPMSERTIYVPIGVSVDSDGTYTFALPEEMEGMDVRIADAETGYTHNLLFSPYEVSLTAGSHTQRFSLEIHASSQVTTGCSETDAAGERLRKVLLDGHFIIQRGERLYDAQGKRLW